MASFDCVECRASRIRRTCGPMSFLKRMTCRNRFEVAASPTPEYFMHDERGEKNQTRFFRGIKTGWQLMTI